MESVVELGLKNKKEKTLNGGAQNGDDFSVDDLLDFSNEDALVEDETDLKKAQRKRELSDNETTLHDMSNDFSAADFPTTTELAVPMDDLAELEWLSNFVEDSFTPYSSSAPTKKPVWLTGNRRRSVPSSSVNEDSSCFKAPPPPPPVQIRPKRARTGVTVWSHGSPSSSSSSSSSSSGPASPLWLSGSEWLFEPMIKKTKKNAGQTQTQLQSQTQSRRCNHCGVQKTPQWRAGPLGAKTLCNACGVRYKSGRLLPEYRPACSPTFSSDLHSNHHRKVIEMRRKKETSEEGDDEIKTVQAVPSF